MKFQRGDVVWAVIHNGRYTQEITITDICKNVMGKDAAKYDQFGSTVPLSYVFHTKLDAEHEIENMILKELQRVRRRIKREEAKLDKG